MNASRWQQIIHFEDLLYQWDTTSFGWLLLMGALYLIGATLYATRMPERFFPGKCDLWVSTSAKKSKQPENQCICVVGET